MADDLPQVGLPEQGKQTSPIVKSPPPATKRDEGEEPGQSTGIGECMYNGNSYSSGATVCSAGSVLQCSMGSWFDTGRKCTKD